jgi:hypothetical protein
MGGGVVAMEPLPTVHIPTRPSLQELSAVAVADILAEVIEYEYVVQAQALPSAITDWISPYVPSTTATFKIVVTAVVRSLVRSTTISAEDKIAFIKKNQQNKALDVSLVAEYLKELPEDMLEYFSEKIVHNTYYQDSNNLMNLITGSFGLSVNDCVELLLSAASKAAYDTEWSLEAKYRFLHHIIKTGNMFTASLAQMSDFIDEVGGVLQAAFLSTIDTKQPISTLVRSIVAGSQQIAQLMHIKQSSSQTHFTILNEMLCTVMLSDTLTIQQKNNVVQEVLQMFGQGPEFYRLGNFFVFLKKYFTDAQSIFNVNTPFVTQEVTSTLLHVALIKFHSNPLIFKQLMKNGANVNGVDSMGRTPLYNALALGSLSVVRTLLQHGARIDVIDSNGQTPLHAFIAHIANAAILENVLEDIIEMMISYKAPLNVHDINNKTVLELWEQVTTVSPECYEHVKNILTKASRY